MYVCKLIKINYYIINDSVIKFDIGILDLLDVRETLVFL